VAGQPIKAGVKADGQRDIESAPSKQFKIHFPSRWKPVIDQYRARRLISPPSTSSQVGRDVRHVIRAIFVKYHCIS
jgi:hypothetical protein